MTTDTKFRQAFATSLDISIDQVTDQLSYNTIPEWDSTAHMILIAELENQFSIMLDTDDIIDLSSVLKAKQIAANISADR